MLDTILFDLHGTLLPIDFQQFMDIYFQEMGEYFRDLLDPQTLKAFVLTATHTVVKNTGDQTNETVFMENFATLIDQPPAVFKQRFDEFYDRGFLKTQTTAFPIPIIPDTVKLLHQKGYQLVITTNPIFPQKAVFHFIEWAGLNPRDFAYISCFEQNHFCKPNPLFYREILQTTGKSPAQCLMVGNDSGEDLVAETVGIKTYLITDFLIHQTPEEFQSAYQGSYEDFYRFATGLPPIPMNALCS